MLSCYNCRCVLSVYRRDEFGERILFSNTILLAVLYNNIIIATR